MPSPMQLTLSVRQLNIASIHWLRLFVVSAIELAKVLFVTQAVLNTHVVSPTQAAEEAC